MVLFAHTRKPMGGLKTGWTTWFHGNIIHSVFSHIIRKLIAPMFKFLKKTFFKTADDKDTATDLPLEPEAVPAAEKEAAAVASSQLENTADTPEIESPPAQKAPSFFSRLKQGLQKTRRQFTDKLSLLFLGKKTIDKALFQELEEILLTADVGFEVTQQILNRLTQAVSRQSLSDPEQLFGVLKTQLTDLLKACELPYQDTQEAKPFVVLMIGINGAGKTTTIGKMAKQFQQNGHKVMLAAGDTFRAAAVEQLKVWGERNDIPVIHQETGADSASVIFDAFQAAKARNYDVLFADTAGRLHNKQNLMEELKKIIRVLKKHDVTAPHEVLLVLDATTGQNAIRQAQQFHEAVGVTGLVITKLDGTAKGGSIFAIASALKLPIRFIGVGEKIDDLKPFSAAEFVDALFKTTETEEEQPQEINNHE
jgi:fused signal recognition particle receptor